MIIESIAALAALYLTKPATSATKTIAGSESQVNQKSAGVISADQKTLTTIPQKTANPASAQMPFRIDNGSTANQPWYSGVAVGAAGVTAVTDAVSSIADLFSSGGDNQDWDLSAIDDTDLQSVNEEFAALDNSGTESDWDYDWNADDYDWGDP